MTDKKTAESKTVESAEPLSIADVLAFEAYPYTMTVPMAGRTVTIHHREMPTDRLARVTAVIGEKAAALGFDPKVWTRARLDAQIPTGEELLALEAAVEVLDEAGRQKRDDLALLAMGAEIACIIGSWDMKEPPTPEICAQLPAPVRRAIVARAQSVTLSDEKKVFAGG